MEELVLTGRDLSFLVPWYVTLPAEALASLALVLSVKRKGGQIRTVLLFAALLAVQTGFLLATWKTEGWLWLLFRCLAAGLIVVWFHLNIEGGFSDAVYLGMEAFLTSEFCAAFAWQFCLYFSFFWQTHWFQFLWILFFELAFFFLFAVFARKLNPGGGSLRTEKKEWMTVTFISLTAFFLSNLSYFPVLTPFTILDPVSECVEHSMISLCGLIGLLAYSYQRSDLRARRERDMMHDLLNSQYMQYEQYREGMDLINRKYHDLKHQINVLRTLDTSEKRAAFLDQMEEELKSYTVQYKTGNAVADTILTSKGSVCDRHGIEFHCVVDGEKLAFMEPADICSLLGNALDNAIEYEQMLPLEEKRLIDVAIFAQKSLLIMKFTNYFEGNLELQDGMPVTTKEKKEYHGFGMKSIRLTAEKYGGTMGFEVQNNWFCLKVLIPIPAAREDA